ncbi:SRPBCC family protein [Actinomadura barringtoniae]|uniref:SRPBCC family protein n=1 Tax=Actinomadura barringtoniae TaxID=1427535 RepID=A0A939P8E5_9ACTN|nr:SRPBCC family protein [Actinomadura barringtoniae]MBO2447583.1 SRPBCC family protein [Actinomadura barringtoniae]
MASFVHEMEIARPPDVVFGYACDPSRFPEWQRDVESVRVEGDRVEGDRFVTTRRIGRSRRTMTQEVTRNEPPVAWAARGTGGPVRPNAEVVIEPLDGGTRSRATFVLDFEGRGIGRLLVPLVVRRMTRRYAPLSFQRLKEILEKS